MSVDNPENIERTLVLQGEFHDIAPVVTPEQAKAAMALYQQIAEAITDESDYQTFTDDKGKPHKFRKRGGWKKLERFFFVSVEIRDERIFHNHDPRTCLRVRLPEHFKDVADCGCPTKGVRMWVRAVDTRTGRYSDNVGVCVLGERRLSSKASLHDLATRAFNRGANRATADLLGVSDPSAEERQAEGGLSKEERVALRNAWDDASGEKRDKALIRMQEITGLDDAPDKDVYVAFLRRASDETLSEIMEILVGEPDEFDPDDIPEGGS